MGEHYEENTYSMGDRRLDENNIKNNKINNKLNNKINNNINNMILINNEVLNNNGATKNNNKINSDSERNSEINSESNSEINSEFNSKINSEMNIDFNPFPKYESNYSEYDTKDSSDELLFDTQESLVLKFPSTRANSINYIISPTFNSSHKSSFCPHIPPYSDLIQLFHPLLPSARPLCESDVVRGGTSVNSDWTENNAEQQYESNNIMDNEERDSLENYVESLVELDTQEKTTYQENNDDISALERGNDEEDEEEKQKGEVKEKEETDKEENHKEVVEKGENDEVVEKEEKKKNQDNVKEDGKTLENEENRSKTASIIDEYLPWNLKREDVILDENNAEKTEKDDSMVEESDGKKTEEDDFVVKHNGIQNRDKADSIIDGNDVGSNGKTDIIIRGNNVEQGEKTDIIIEETYENNGGKTDVTIEENDEKHDNKDNLIVETGDGKETGESESLLEQTDTEESEKNELLIEKKDNEKREENELLVGISNTENTEESDLKEEASDGLNSGMSYSIMGRNKDIIDERNEKIDENPQKKKNFKRLIKKANNYNDKKIPFTPKSLHGRAEWPEWLTQLAGDVSDSAPDFASIRLRKVLPSERANTTGDGFLSDSDGNGSDLNIVQRRKRLIEKRLIIKNMKIEKNEKKPIGSVSTRPWKNVTAGTSKGNDENPEKHPLYQDDGVQKERSETVKSLCDDFKKNQSDWFKQQLKGYSEK